MPLSIWLVKVILKLRKTLFMSLIIAKMDVTGCFCYNYLLCRIQIRTQIP